jgi:hypothetical protein
MTDPQPQLVGRPRHRREIWASLCSGYDEVIDALWRAALEGRQHVGACGKCGQPLRPREPYTVGAVTWYPAECTSASCDHETAAHGPRPEKPKKGAA